MLRSQRKNLQFQGNKFFQKNLRWLYFVLVFRSAQEKVPNKALQQNPCQNSANSMVYSNFQQNHYMERFKLIKMRDQQIIFIMKSIILGFLAISLIIAQDDMRKFDGGFGFLPKCFNTHNIFAVDKSGSMDGSWPAASYYHFSKWNTGQYASVFTFEDSITNFGTHERTRFTPVPYLGSLSGGTNFNIALQRASDLLNIGYPDSTCIHFVTDGEFSINSNSVNNFLNAKSNFERRTTCRVCVKCIITDTSYLQFSWTQPFRDFCERLGANIQNLHFIVGFPMASMLRSRGSQVSQANPPRD